MAKALLGPIVQQLRGKQGDVVWCYGKTGAYTRALFTPPNPQTQQQQNWRQALGYAWAQWNSTLSEQQRTAWNAAAIHINPHNLTAQPITLSGQQLYVKRSTQLNAASEYPILTPQPNNPPPDPGPLSAVGLSGTPALILTPTTPTTRRLHRTDLRNKNAVTRQKRI